MNVNEIAWSRSRLGTARLGPAFGLLELLVVAAIIALLVAILLPGLRRARQIAQAASCQSNLSQLAKAWEMYLNSHNGSFYQGVGANLVYGGWKGNTTDYRYWAPRPLNRFVGLPAPVETEGPARVFGCPADSGKAQDNPARAYDYFGTSFQTNIFLIGQNNVQPGGPKYILPLYDAIRPLLPNLTISRVTDPSRLILMGDYGWGQQWTPKYPTGVAWHGYPKYYDLAFLDGHVELLRIRKGLFLTPTYRIQPFESLDTLTTSSQREEP